VQLKTFRHSGNLGDIIYSLPAVQALGGGVFYLDDRTTYLGKPPLGRDSALMMAALLETQSYVTQACVYEGQRVDHDLDRFRDKAIPVHIFNTVKSQTDEFIGLMFGKPAKDIRRTLIPKLELDLPQYHWEAAGLRGRVDLSTPWITGIPGKAVAEIVVSKTSRYPGALDWSALQEYAGRSVFVGLEEEWRQFRQSHFDFPFYKAENLLDLARVIAAAKLFIGNQSLPLALADAMHIPRVCELWEISPNRMLSVKAYSNLTRDIVEASITPHKSTSARASGNTQ
jgi:hypothetical protein